MPAQTELQAGTVISTFSPYFDESLSRPLRSTRLEVIQRTASEDGAYPFSVPGTIFAFFTAKESGKMAAVRQAVTQGGEPARDLLRNWKEQMSLRKKVPVNQAVGLIVKSPVFAELEYGGSTLANGIFLPEGLECAILMFPYNGGLLAEEGFVLSEHYQEGSSAAIEGLILQTVPKLTSAEVSALQLVPASQNRLNVGMTLSCCTTGAAVASVVADIVLLLIALLEPVYKGAAEINIPAEEIEKLGPSASARKMLQLRRQFLTEHANERA